MMRGNTKKMAIQLSGETTHAQLSSPKTVKPITARTGTYQKQKVKSPLPKDLSKIPLTQHRSRLLNLLLSITGYGMTAMFLLLLLTDLPNFDFEILLPVLASMLIVLVCYFVNRFGFTTVAALIFLLTAELLVIYYVSSRPDAYLLSNLRGASPLLVIPVVAAGVIIGPVYSFVFAGMSVASVVIMAVARAKPGIPSLETPLEALYQSAVVICLLFIMASLAAFFESNFRSLIAQLTTQNVQLNDANLELAYKGEVEQQISLEVNLLTSKVLETFEEQNTNTTEQISAIFKVTSTVDQLSQTNRAITTAARKVDTTAQNTLQTVERGTARVRSGLQSLTILNQQARVVSSSLMDLSQRAQQIDQITEMIEGIAEETNLLALNATIEAAGAGEYGQRFGVVAREVKSLANRSQTATSQARQVLSQVQEAIGDSLTLARRSLNETELVMDDSRSMELTLEEIVQMVENTATLAFQIATSLEEQHNSTDEVAKTMHHVSGLSKSLHKGSQQLTGSLSHLNAAVARLKK